MDLPISELAARAKEACTVIDVAAWFGYNYSETDNHACPRCESVSSSRKTLRVYGPDRWHCFHCDAGGDQIDWLAGKLRVTKGGAIKTLALRLGIDLEGGELADIVRHQLFPQKLAELRNSTIGDLEAAEVLKYRRETGYCDAKDGQGWIACIRMARSRSAESRAKAVSIARDAARGRPFPSLATSTEHLRNGRMAILYADKLATDRGVYREYAKSRGWLDHHAEAFRLGCCLSGDFMAGRIVFPIRDASGRVSGFGGRLVDPKAADPKHAGAKYLNSADRGGFQKGRELFGLDLALPSILALGYVVVVEGYGDVLACHADDVPNVVAPLGGAMSSRHAEILACVCDQAVHLGDGDDAGRKAARRWAVALRGARIDSVRANLPEGQDPDDMWRSRPGSLRTAVNTARTPRDPLADVARRMGRGF